MLVTHRYYTLVASLPYLEHFERLERNPITRLRLDQRLSSLRLDHGNELEEAERLVEWHREAPGKTDADVVERFRHALAVIETPSLHAFVSLRMEQRTVMAGLRRRQRGEPAPAAHEVWGTEPRAAWVRTHWDQPDFGLATHYPWVGEAARLVRERNALGLERLLMNIVWTRLGHIVESDPFGFEAVFAFVFKWDIASRWLSYQPASAAKRFGELVMNALGEHDAQFA